MAQMLQAPIEGYEDGIVVPPINANNFDLKQTLINLVQSNQFTDTFYNALNPNDQDAFDSAVGGNFLVKIPRDGLSIIKSKSKVRYSRSRVTDSRLDTFYNALNPNDQDALDSAVGGNFLVKIPRDGLSIIKSKSKVRYSRSHVTDSRVSTNAPLSSSSPTSSFDLQQIAASFEDKLDIRMNRFEKSLNDMKAFVTSPAPIKAVD
nr:hypothetical protein [Tanacetum cinerariifolium]